MVLVLTAILAAYLVGAIPFGLLVARFFGVRDIRQSGSGNIGATNVQRTLGMKAAVWVYLLDIGKGAGVVVAAAGVTQTAVPTDHFLVLVGMAAIVGHVFPVYLGFRGGKGVATAFGALLVLLPRETLIAVVVFLLMVFLTRYVSLASIAAALSFPATLMVEQALHYHHVSSVYWLLTVVIGILVPVTHRRNIQRLLAGTENRVTFRRSGGESL
ncbi:MAG: glycerol-3-phosphate 1-O-acyltransferase PlsY [candidate division Zixibacteria bacterium]|nr:glycerol-3-phosphate 1-O-acyltransferase PlsY [candidate division Zixibacteria bacterium]